MAESLFLNKMKADIYTKPITRKIQIGEVSEVDQRKSSYSYTIKLPDTARNRAIFEMLGVVGNTSRKPYENIVADYIVDGVYLVLNGSAIIRGTSGDYELNIIDGIRSLAETLKDKKLAGLPLDDLNHVLSTQSYIDSYSNTEGFIYGLANFGRGVGTSVKVEKQAPSIFTHTIFRRIFESNGLSLQGEFFTTNEKYLTEVLTPSRGYEVEFATLTSTPKGTADSNTLSDYQFSNDYITFEEKFTMTDGGLTGASVVGGDIVFSVAGTYRIDLTILYNLYKTYASLIFKVNGSSKSYIYLDGEYSQTKNKSITFSVQAGDTVSFYISGGSNFDYEDPIHEGFTVNYSASFDSSLYLLEGGQVIEAADYIGDMNQLDFLKDVVNRYGLVLHPVQNTGEFKFRRLEALLNDRATAEDWTSKLAAISGENYVSGYAKVNKANYQYPEEIVVPNNDGSMLIDNENAEAEKQMFSSPFEIPVANNSSIGGEPVYKIPIWSIGDPETVTVETELNNDAETFDFYLNIDGTETAGTGKVVRKYENIDASLYIYKASGIVEASDNAFVCFYDISDNFISYQYKGYGSLNEYNKTTLYPPSNCKIIRVSGDIASIFVEETAVYQSGGLSNGAVAITNGFQIPSGQTGAGSYMFARLEPQEFDSALIAGQVIKYVIAVKMTNYAEIDAIPTLQLQRWQGTSAQGNLAFDSLTYEDAVVGSDLTRTYTGTRTLTQSDIDNEYYFRALWFMSASQTAVSVDVDCTMDSIQYFVSENNSGSLFQYEDVEIETANNEETPLKVMHIARVNTSITAKFFNEVTGITTSTNVPVLTLEFMSMTYFLGNFYKAFQNLIENYKKVSLKINLSVIDVFNLDFFRLKFLKQTGRFYYLNSVQHTNGKTSTVEAIEIKEFPVNQPPSQLSDYSFNMNHESTRTITVANLTSGYEDPELDEPLKVKIIDGFNSNILLKQNGVEITAETEILLSELSLQAVEVLGGLDAYSESWTFAIADAGSGSYGTLTATLTANVLELINQPPVANAGSDQSQKQYPDEFGEPTIVTLNGSASYDYTGDIVSYYWEIISKPTSSTSFIAAQNTSNPFAYLYVQTGSSNLGVYTLRLTVTDEFGASDTDEMTVTITPSSFKPEEL